MDGRRIVFESIGKASLQKYEVPDLKPTDVLLESDYSAVSAGTECANLMQLPNTQTTKGFPYCPGYSSAGRVIDA
ncbi:MAG: theronine dehydrogenase, partial [Phycisphaeraceae bacterium JB051]